MDKRYISADEYLLDQWRLAEKVRAGGWRPDYLVGLWRGGAPAAIAVHEFLKFTGWDVRHLPLKCGSYTGIGQSGGKVEFTFGDEVFSLFRSGDRVLFVDDVFDTGRTAAAVVERMRATRAEARVACVYFKSSTSGSGIMPDYFVRDLGDDWIVFPHELEGLSAAEVRVKSPVLAAMLERFA